MDNLVVRVVSALCADVGTPRALAVKLLVHHGEWTQLQELRCKPSHYWDSESYWQDCLVTDLLRKCDLPTSVNKEAAAEQTFLDCEVQNCSTNARLSRFMPADPLLEDIQDERVFTFIGEWRKEVSRVMGNLPSTLTPRFSGGATYADSGVYTTTPDKMSSTPTIYCASRCLLPLWSETLWARNLIAERPWQSDPCTVRGNIFFTVPKDGKTFRGCCKEASINVGYQLDVDRILKERLLLIGIDLARDKEKHMRLAREASVDQRLATFDMSNASDTLCRVLPALVLRRDWHELLDSLRATHTWMRGKWHRLEKFSSMGNGFTFTLETVLFATLARTVVTNEGGDPDDVSCYGDDLIAPAIHYDSIMAALRFFGFTPNMKKTFKDGPFRESCGGDYFDGVPVRAHYLEELPDEPQQWIALANGLRRVAHADPGSLHRWRLVRTAWLRCLDPIPSHIRRCRGPVSLGDIVIHDEPDFWDRAEPPTLRDPHTSKVIDQSTWDMEWVRAYCPIPLVLNWNNWTPAVQLAAATLGLPSSGVTPRDGVSGYRIRRVPCGGSNWSP